MNSQYVLIFLVVCLYITYNKYHNFGFFVNVLSRTNSTIIQEKSDLIGNGILTNYIFLLPKIEILFIVLTKKLYMHIVSKEFTYKCLRRKYSGHMV